MFAFVAVPVECRLDCFFVPGFESSRPRRILAILGRAHPTAPSTSSNRVRGRNRNGKEDPVSVRQLNLPCRCHSTLKCTKDFCRLAATGMYPKSIHRNLARCRDRLRTKFNRNYVEKNIVNCKLPSTMITKS